MKFCPRCGEPLDGNHKFCMNCGEDLRLYQDPAQTEKKPEEPRHSAPDADAQDVGSASTPSPDSDGQKPQTSAASALSPGSEEQKPQTTEKSGNDHTLRKTVLLAATAVAVLLIVLGIRELILTIQDTSVTAQIEEGGYLEQLEEWMLETQNDDSVSAGTHSWYLEGLAELTNQLTHDAFWEMEDDMYLGIYASDFTYSGYVGIYYGTLTSWKKRSESGIWVVYDPNDSDTSFMNYIYVGEWSNDYPNGDGIYRKFFCSSDSDSGEDLTGSYYEMEINFTDGLPDGTGVLRYIFWQNGSVLQGGECDVEADMGDFPVLWTDEETGIDYGAEIDLENGNSVSIDSYTLKNFRVTGAFSTDAAGS